MGSYIDRTKSSYFDRVRITLKGRQKISAERTIINRRLRGRNHALQPRAAIRTVKKSEGMALVQFGIVAASLPRQMVRQPTDKAVPTSSCAITEKNGVQTP